MVDIDLLVKVLRRRGHKVESPFPVPENAGDWELSVDGNLVTLEQAREILDRNDIQDVA